MIKQSPQLTQVNSIPALMKHYVNIAHSEKENLEGDPRNTSALNTISPETRCSNLFPPKNSNCSLFADPTP